DIAIDVDVAIWELARPLTGVDKQSTEPAIDIDPGVTLRRAGRIGQVVELVLPVTQSFGERLQQIGTLVKGQLAKIGAADVAGMFEDRPQFQNPCGRGR